MASRKHEHIEQITERCLIAQKKFSFKEGAERDNIDATDLDVLRTVPTIVIAHTFCASRDTRVSYR